MEGISEHRISSIDVSLRLIMGSSLRSVHRGLRYKLGGTQSNHKGKDVG